MYSHSSLRIPPISHMKEFIKTEVKAETAILVGLITKEQSERKTNEYLDELEFLAETAGTAIRESMAILSSLPDVKVAATFVMVDRKEKGQGEKGAMQEIEEQFGFPVYSVVDVYDIIEYLEEDPANEENVTRIKNYLAVNGAKV